MLAAGRLLLRLGGGDRGPGPVPRIGGRSRAAIAAAKAEEEPAGRRPGWIPGRRSHGRRRVAWIATAAAVAAAVAGLLAVLLPGSPVTRGSGAQIETTAFVTRVEHALSESGQRNVVGYARTVYPPGYSIEAVGRSSLRVSPGTGSSSPWSVAYLVRWFYQDSSKVSAFSAAGHRVFDLGFAPVRGTLTSTAVFYRSRTWWRAGIGPVPAGNGPAPMQCGPDIQLGPGGWPAFLRHELSCGEFAKDGPQRIGGIGTVKLTGDGGREIFWVNPHTYLPVRVAITAPSGPRLRTDFSWLVPTQARLAQLHVSVPRGFRQVSPP